MTKNDRRQFDIARKLAAAGMCNAAVRTIATVHRCAMRTATKDAAMALVIELDLANRVAIVNGCMVHVDDAPQVFRNVVGA